MKKLPFLFIFFANLLCAQWPMFNDPNFDYKQTAPTYAINSGPLVLFDAAHKNFFVQSHLVKPFVDLLLADGYRVAFNDKPLSEASLNKATVLVIITALPFDFTTQLSAADLETFSTQERLELKSWVYNGGSLLVFSEHAPFDQAINPLLKTFDIETSIGVTIDTLNYDKTYHNMGMIKFSGETLNKNHPIVAGKRNVDQLVSFGGSALTGSGYTNILKLGEHAVNVQHATGIGQEGQGNSQGLAGYFGKGKVAAFGDSNGFTAMLFYNDDHSYMAAGMNTKGYDWKNFVLNTFDWLAPKNDK